MVDRAPDQEVLPVLPSRLKRGLRPALACMLRVACRRHNEGQGCLRSTGEPCRSVLLRWGTDLHARSGKVLSFDQVRDDVIRTWRAENREIQVVRFPES